MKALRTTLAAVILLVGAMTLHAQSMSITAMRSNARFLTDRMAYTLNIRDPFLIDEMYRINYDYILGVNGYLDDVALGYYYDDYMAVCAARDLALRNLLGVRIWNSLIGYSYFHRPIVFANRGWHFSIYDHDRYGAHHFFFHAPRPFTGGYGGGHFFHGMAPKGGRPHVAPSRPNNGRPQVGAPAPNAPNRNNGVRSNPRGQAGPAPSQKPSQPSGNVSNGRTSVANQNAGSRSSNNVRSSSRGNTSSSSSRSNAAAPSSRSNAGATRSSGAGAARGGGRR